MSVPTSYDYNGFATYLKNEVLRQVADSMMWELETGADIAAASPQVIQLNGATTDNSRTITVDALPTAIYKGNEITFTGHGTTYTVTTDAVAGATTVYVFPYVNGVIADNTVGSYTPNHVRATNPVYRYITDEALTFLGYRTIAEVSSADIKKFRLLGRIEAWRTVLGNTTSDVTVSEDGGTLARQQVYNMAREQLDIAQAEYNSLFGNTELISADYVSSGWTNVKAVW